jgi:hypothetical protein
MGSNGYHKVLSTFLIVTLIALMVPLRITVQAFESNLCNLKKAIEKNSILFRSSGVDNAETVVGKNIDLANVRLKPQEPADLKIKASHCHF